MKIFRVIFLLSIFISSLFSQISLNTPNSVVRDEPYVFVLEITGEDIKLPPLDKIASFEVQNISNSTSTSIINSKITKKIKKVYSFYPNKDFEFPSLSFEVDGKEYLSKAKKVFVTDAKKTQSNLFDLSIFSNKKELYVGENFILTMKFRFKTNTEILDLSLEKPSFENFWFKTIGNKRYEENGFIVQELNYLLFPQKAGSLKISPMKVNTQYVDVTSNSFSFFSNSISSKKIFSNSLTFEVKELPSTVTLIGDFNIKTEVDKNKLEENEALSFKVIIEGSGNFDDLDYIKLDIKNTTIYENKPEINTSYENQEYKGIYKKVFSILADESFIIPSISIKYFDNNLKKVVEKSTKEFKITVDKKTEKNEASKLEKLEKNVEKKEIIKVIEKSSIKDKVIYFTLGIISTLLILGLYKYVITLKKKKELDEIPLIKKVKKTKSKKELLKTLSVYININSDLDKLIFELEKSKDIKEVKTSILKLLKQIDLKAK